MGVSSFIGIIRRALAAWLVFATALVAAPEENYRLAPNDLLEVRIFQEPDLDTKAPVSADGKIALPLVGEVSVGGRTVAEAVSLVKAAYRDGFLVNPQVGITVAEYGKRQFTVLGQVARPGVYIFPDGRKLTLLEAIGMAGGYTRIASPSRITIRRSGGEPVRVDGKKIASGEAASVEVRVGDIINVGESIF